MATLSVQDVVARAFAEMLLSSERWRAEAFASWGPGICGGTFAETADDGGTTIATLSESFGGGGGARTFADGIDSGGVFHSMASRIGNVEAHESRGHLLELFRREACDAGGAGRFRGGAGDDTRSPRTSSRNCRLITRSSGVAMPGGRGLAGGYPGAPVASVVLRGSDVAERFARGSLPSAAAEIAARETVVLAAKALTALEEGDVLISVTPGGGGYGDPRHRDAECSSATSRCGLVSAELASERVRARHPRRRRPGRRGARAWRSCAAAPAARCSGPGADQRNARRRPRAAALGARRAASTTATRATSCANACPACGTVLAGRRAARERAGARGCPAARRQPVASPRRGRRCAQLLRLTQTAWSRGSSREPGGPSRGPSRIPCSRRTAWAASNTW